jgi:hypothetical protein
MLRFGTKTSRDKPPGPRLKAISVHHGESAARQTTSRFSMDQRFKVPRFTCATAHRLPSSQLGVGPHGVLLAPARPVFFFGISSVGLLQLRMQLSFAASCALSGESGPGGTTPVCTTAAGRPNDPGATRSGGESAYASLGASKARKSTARVSDIVSTISLIAIVGDGDIGS